MVVPSLGIGRAHRGLRGDHLTAGGSGGTALAAGAQRRTAGGGYFVSRCKAGRLPPGGGK